MRALGWEGMTRARLYPPTHGDQAPATHLASFKMNTAEDDDLKLLRASASNLSDLERLVTQLVRKRKNEFTGIRPQVRLIDLGRVQALV